MVLEAAGSRIGIPYFKWRLMVMATEIVIVLIYQPSVWYERHHAVPKFGASLVYQTKVLAPLLDLEEDDGTMTVLFYVLDLEI
ncbi:hypothetical protein P8452_55658 [Trifolium repens]|nr:hypothetical protein P8452_55658 [Trifolium repens]